MCSRVFHGIQAHFELRHREDGAEPKAQQPSCNLSLAQSLQPWPCIPHPVLPHGCCSEGTHLNKLVPHRGLGLTCLPAHHM